MTYSTVEISKMFKSEILRYDILSTTHSVRLIHLQVNLRKKQN